MQFNKDTLIKAIDTGLANDAESRQFLKEYEERVVEEHRQDWLENQRPRFVAERDALTKALKKKFITSDDYSTNRSSLIPFSERPYDVRNKIDDRRREHRGVLINRTEFESLKAALEAMEGDTVSDRQLQVMGFGAGSISSIFRSAQADQ